MNNTFRALWATALFLIIFASLVGCGRYVAGNMALAKGNYQEAEAAFQGILSENPDDMTARRRLAMTYFYMGRDVEAGHFEQAAKQFALIQESRAANPEEQFHHGLSLIGLGRRAAGFDILKSFRHPTQFRVQQYVRERAAQLEAEQELPFRTILREMERAWREGEEMDEQERRDNRFDDRRSERFSDPRIPGIR